MRGLAAVAALLLWSCRPAQKPPADEELKLKVDRLEGQLTLFQESMKGQEQDSETLWDAVLAMGFHRATFDPASPEGYQRLDSGSGFFLIALEDTAPQIDGFKVRLRIGNPSQSPITVSS